MIRRLERKLINRPRFHFEANALRESGDRPLSLNGRRIEGDYPGNTDAEDNADQKPMVINVNWSVGVKLARIREEAPS